MWRSDRDVPSRHRQKRERRKYNRVHVAAPDWLIEYAEGGGMRYVTFDAKNHRELTVTGIVDHRPTFYYDAMPDGVLVEIHDARLGKVYWKTLDVRLDAKDFFPQLRRFLLTEGRSGVWNCGRNVLRSYQEGLEFRCEVAFQKRHRLASWGEGKAVR